MSESCFKGSVLQRKYRFFMLFSYNSFVKFNGKTLGAKT